MHQESGNLGVSSGSFHSRSAPISLHFPLTHPFKHLLLSVVYCYGVMKCVTFNTTTDQDIA